MVADGRPALPCATSFRASEPSERTEFAELASDPAVRTLHALFWPGFPARPELWVTCTP